jgi:hypothetical protein
VLPVKPGITERFKRLKEARSAFQSIPEERALSVMPIDVHYVAHVGQVQLVKRADEFVFTICHTVRDDVSKEQWWEEVLQDAFAIRDNFLKIKTPSEALDFLSQTGQFSPLHFNLTWSEFQRWRRFAWTLEDERRRGRVVPLNQDAFLALTVLR